MFGGEFAGGFGRTGGADQRQLGFFLRATQAAAFGAVVAPGVVELFVVPVTLDHIHELAGPRISVVVAGDVADLALHHFGAAVDDVPHQAVAAGALVGSGHLRGDEGREMEGLERTDEFQRAGFPRQQ